MGKRNSVLTEEQKQEAFKAYENGESGTSIAKRYGVWPNTIYGLMRRRDIKRRNLSESHRKYKIDETFFDDIDTEEKAYILGLLYADGSNNEKKGQVYIMLAETDVDILRKIQKIVQPQRPLHYSKRKGDNPKHQNRYMWCINNQHISKKLAEYGCIQNKTFKLTFPDWLDKSLYNHFVRGYFDGDGHVGIYKDGYSWRAQISFVGTEAFCKNLINIFKTLDININKLYNRYPERDNNIRTIQFGGNRQVERFLNWLYKDSTLYMNRKFNKYSELLVINMKGMK